MSVHVAWEPVGDPLKGSARVQITTVDHYCASSRGDDI